MWSPAFFCFFLAVGVLSANNPAWKENAEYVYQVRGRTLASLYEVSNQYSGIFFKAKLRIQPRSDGRLQAELGEAQYSQIHSQLVDGWNTDIPEAELSWKPLAISSKPFQIELKQGAVDNLIVSKDVPNWEANIIKSVVSQFQLDTYGGRSDRYERENSAAFLTMEDTVTGNTETFYKVNPLPDYIVQGMYKGQAILEQKGDGQVYEVVKHKNYTNAIELPSYFYGFGGLENGFPATNKMGYFFVRNSISRAILTGNMKRYTIQRSSTVNEVIVNPTLSDKQRGGVFSQMNVTLQGVKSQDQKIPDVPNPVRLGNLVYSYGKPSQHNNVQSKSSYENSDYEMYRYQRASNKMRLRRSLYENEEAGHYKSEESYKQQHPQIQEAPESPLLPYTMGYKGMPVKQGIDIVKSVVQLAQDIARDLQKPEQMQKENTGNKFTILAALIKTMNSQEMQKAAGELYYNADDETRRDAWQVYRDGVAEAGTGPAFVAIQGWIQSKKITGLEASLVLAAMSRAVRQPTPQYMRSFFELVKSQEVQSQWPLNDTALLSYAKLARTVYVAGKKSREQYPIKSFPPFNNQEGRTYMEETVIPYYSQELSEAISRGNTHRIHVLIRALGNFAHPAILQAFEPYLEGKKQASQYQRLLMVVAMDKLAQYYPQAARDALFRIYQNTGESEEVRVAAVYQLVRTNPDTETFQLMAAYTNIDQHEHVNAAVKSSIESAAALKYENPELIKLRIAAEQARPLLTDKIYGIQHGANFLRSRFIEQLRIRYKESAEIIGSPDHFMPKGLKYKLKENFGGSNQRSIDFQAMVSSIKELTLVFKKLTQQYLEQQSQQKSSYAEQKQNQWSSQSIASQLNMKSEELEQLEGSLYLEMGSPYGLISFDNMTMKRLPEAIREQEEQLRNGKKINLVKIINEREMALSFPTETGLPFLFTYDTPIIVNVKGSIQGSSNPQIAQGNKLHTPDVLRFKSKLNVVVTRKVLSRITFITPFEHQQYIAGFDKNAQIHIPVQGTYEVDIKTMQAKMELEPQLPEPTVLFHYSTWPYTSRVDITSFVPVSAQPNTHLLPQSNLHGYDKIWGKQETGLAFRVQVQHERPLLNLPELKDLYVQHGPAAVLMRLWDDAQIQYSQINLSLIPEQSSTQRIIIRLGHQHQYKKSGPQSEPEFTYSEQPLERQQNIMEKVSSGIKNVKIEAIDAEVQFQGEKNIKHFATAAFAKSDVDPKSRVLGYYKKKSESSEVQPYQASLDAKNDVPNTNALDLDYSMQHEPRAKSQITLIFGQSQESSPSKIEAQFEFTRTEGRKEYLKNQPMYHQCQSEMSKGNKQLPACVNQTMEANLLDHVEAKIQYQNLEHQFKSAFKTLYHTWRFYYAPTAHVDNKETAPGNQIWLQAHFYPDLKAVNVSVKTPEEHTKVHNIKVGPYVKEIVVVHPVFHLRSRLISKAWELPYYKPFCVVDKTKASTFNNNTFPAEISKYWTVMFQYIPRVARYPEYQMTLDGQMKHQTEHYAVLVRESSQGSQKKDFKITLSSPRTQYKVLDITMSPQQDGSQFQGTVKVNGQVVKLSEKESYTYDNGYIQIYGLPNGEVKVEIENGFYVVYDGTRARLTVAESKFRNGVRGICGQYNDEKIEDLYAPVDCITSNTRKFIKSYEIEGQEGQQVRQEFSRPGNKQCVRKEVPLYVNVVSQDLKNNAESWGQRSEYEYSSGECTSYQTRYVEQNGEICFTNRAMPKCKGRCQPRGTITKNVPVHCIEHSNVAQLWKEQIDNGANPDFSHKQESKTVSMQLPQSCSE